MLNSNGLLPVGRHTVTVDQFREHFVDAFPESKSRGRLFRRWQQHRESLTSMIAVRSQWIDGSFVTSKADPGDIDLVSFMDGATYDGLAPGLREMVLALVAGDSTRGFWSMDSYPVFEFDAGHRAAVASASQTDYWHQWWQRSRTEDGIVKGYLEVVK